MRFAVAQMKRLTAFLLLLLTYAVASVHAQDLNTLTDDGELTTSKQRNANDSANKKKEIPKGLKVWTIDQRFGDRRVAEIDTLPHLFMNTQFSTGLRSEYNTTGNLGAPRINRIATDRALPQQFMFTQPYDYFNTAIDQFHFTNTLSPITNISFLTCGNKENGEDHLKALFAVNAGKRLGVGFKFDYIYGRGYYQNQSTAHFNYTMYGSYLGDRYQAHLLLATNHQKVTENGGITNDQYVTHPEIFGETFRNNEIPTVLQNNWNRNDNQQVFLTHRYSLGFNRKVKMTEEEIKAKKFAMESKKENDARKAKEEARKKAKREGYDFDADEYDRQSKEQAQRPSGRPDGAKIMGNEPKDTLKDANSNRIAVTSKEMADSLLAQTTQTEEDTSWMKNEFVPVTSFIHTLDFRNYKRIYQSYYTPSDYYLESYDIEEKYAADSIFDQTKHYELKNTFALSLLEGFNKWAKAGLKAFISYDMRHFTLPDTVASGISSYNEHNVSVGGQIAKTEGNTLHYSATAETWLTGEDAGQLKIDGHIDLNFPLFKDTVRLSADGGFYRLAPTFYQRHFHSKHLWWDNDLGKETRLHVEGTLNYEKTRTRLRVAFDDMKDLVYFANSYTVTEAYGRAGNIVTVNQCTGNISLLTLQLSQDFTFGPLNWETLVTYQKTSNEAVLPVPDLNIYTNLFLQFKIAKVLRMDLGADLRWFSKYYAPDYSPYIGQYVVQDNGDENVEIGNYPIVNIYANMHLKHTRFYLMLSHVNAGSSGNRFFTPHYPLNGMIIRMGVSWNFFN